VLCYSPYTLWALHGLWETTILHGARLRGAEVRHVLCDALYDECDIFWGAVNPRHPRGCLECQMEQAKLMYGQAEEYEWLGRYLLPDERREAQRFANAVPDSELRAARYGDWAVGEWVASSVHSHFRDATLDLGDPRVAHVFRRYVKSGLVAAFALTRLLDDFQPDVLLQFNGRQSSTRVSFELARARGIRVIGHESGNRSGHLYVCENEPTTSLEPLRRIWADWRDVALAEDELAEVVERFREREHGRAMYHSYNTDPDEPAAVRQALGLKAGRPLWVVFTSSDDEVAEDPQWQGPLPSQLGWIERTVEWAAAHPELDLVIRAHPNTGGKASTGRNETLLRAYDALGRRLPANCRLVGPTEELSSYTLMSLCDVGLVWHSTVAIELALKGKQTLVASGCPARGRGFTVDVEDGDGYEGLLDDLAARPGPLPLEQVRLAYRFAFRAFCRADVPFPLVEMTDARTGSLAYTTLEELAPGRDPSLDRICRILLEGEPVFPAPAAGDLARPTDAEDAFLRRFAPPRTFAVLAAADEVIADASILDAWAAQFRGGDEATLYVETAPPLVDALVAAVVAAGLDGDDSAEIVATDAPPAAVSAVLSRRPAAHAPTFDPERAAELRSLAAAYWEAA
jgi:hypothetical protein